MDGFSAREENPSHGRDENHMAYILDGGVILILIVAVAVGCHRGFFKSLILLVGSLAAMVLAGLLSTPLASFTFDTFISGGLQETIAARIEEAGAGSAADGLEVALSELPGPIAHALQAYAGTPEEIVDTVRDSLSGSASAAAQTVVTAVIRPVAVALLGFLLFFILFVLLMIVVRLLARLVRQIARLPVLKQADGLLGGLLGLVEGALLVLVAVTVVQLIAASAGPDAILTSEDVKDSILVSRIAEHNPVTGALDAVLDALPEGMLR